MSEQQNNQDILGLQNVSAERMAEESLRQRNRRTGTTSQAATSSAATSAGMANSTTGTTVPTSTGEETVEQAIARIQSQGSAFTEGKTGLPANYQLPTRQWTNQLTGQVETYSGNELINLTTGATQRMYLIDQDPTAIIGQKLTTEGPQGLLKFLKNLEGLGFYEGARVGNGTSGNDIGAVASFLRYANMQGLEMNSALAAAYQQIPGNFRTGGGGGTRVTNASDLRAVFQSVAMSTLGRGLKPREIESMITAYQQIERRSGSVAAPNAQVYADEALRGRFKGEAEDFRALNVADTMLNIIRGS